MLNQYLTPEVVVLSAGIACLFAVIALILAGRRALVRGMASSLAALETQIAARQRILEDTGERMVAAAELQKRVDHLEKRLTALQQDIQPVEAKHLKAVADYEDAKAQLRTTRDEWNQLRERVDIYKDRVAKVEALEQEIAGLQKQRADLDVLVKSLPERQRELGQLEQTIGTRQKDMDDQQKAIKQMAVEKETLAEKIVASRKAVEQCEADLLKRKEEIGKLENAKIDLDARLETLSDRIKKVGRMPVEAFDSLNIAVFDVTKKTRAAKDEKSALQGLEQLIDATGFEIPRRLQRAFHTALKTSDISCLTVMAGVSGTGKSAFPKLYAHAMGLHFLPLAVEPRWDSPRDLFGFLNYMENRFEATTLGRALVQFNEAPHAPGNLKNQMLLVLLDEMNLARIEYYFSEFLSKLEMRRNSNIARLDDYRNVSVEVFAGYQGDEKSDHSDPVRLFAGSNVLFVGTMNEDESTQSLSDKVIDRANVLHFGKPNRMSERQQRTVPANDWLPLASGAWRDWIKEPSSETIGNYTQVEDLVNKINGTLALLGRPFGWRTYKAIMAYVANHPDVTFGTDPGFRPLADQVAMRVMPKLRGVDLVEHGDVFNALGQHLQQVNDRPLRDAFDKARQSTQGFFDWRGISWDG